MNNWAIVVAAGRGERMGAQVKKQFLHLGGKPVVVHALEAFERSSSIGKVVLVLPEEDRDGFDREVLYSYGINKVVEIISGGKRRQDSVKKGLCAVEQGCNIVVVHDGVRPFIHPSLVERVVEEASLHGAAITGVRPKETVKITRKDDHDMVKETLPREEVVIVQTPQAFRYSLLQEAMEKADVEGIIATDEASLVERLGHPVRIVWGSYLNIKITTKEDLTLAEAILKEGGWR